MHFEVRAKVRDVRHSCIIATMPQYNTSSSETVFKFTYPNPNDKLFTELRQLTALQIDPHLLELEKTKLITGYAHQLFTHNGDNQLPVLEPLAIIREAKSGKSFRCVEYSLLATALLWAYGIPARMVGLKTKDVETREYGAGHVVLEFWNRDNRKWVMCDVQAGIIPTAADDDSDNDNSALLSAFELGVRLNSKQSVRYDPVDGSRFGTSGASTAFKNADSYNQWVREYLYFFDAPISMVFHYTPEELKSERRAMLIPLDAEPPRVFQNSFTMNMVYMHSVLDFYPDMNG